MILSESRLKVPLELLTNVRMMLSSTPAWLRRMTWASGLVGKMFGGNPPAVAELSGGGGGASGDAWAGELMGVGTPVKHRTAIAVPKTDRLKNSILIIRRSSIPDAREYNRVTRL